MVLEKNQSEQLVYKIRKSAMVNGDRGVSFPQGGIIKQVFHTDSTHLNFNLYTVFQKKIYRILRLN